METFYTILESYGLSGICLGLICMILFFVIKYYGNKLTDNMSTGLEKVGEKLSDKMSEQNDHLTEQLSNQNKELTATILSQQDTLINYFVNEKKHEQEHHNQMIGEKEDLSVDINDYVKIINEVHNAQRTYILEFHNHNENLSGTPFVKFTCKYEWYDIKLHHDYIPFLGSLKDVAFAAIAQVFRDVRMSTDHCILYNDLDEFGDKNPSLYYYMIKENTKSLVFKGLYDKNNILIAVIVLEYDHKIKLNDINFNKLHVQAAEITQLINLRYKYEE